ncbi:MAG: PP2C family protein-serine/threonine phosphatase [bacterium]
MNQKLTVRFGSSTHIGLRREDNQDYYGKFPENNLDLTTPGGQLFIVADGMGEHQGGQEASKMVVNIVRQVYFSAVSGNISNSLLQAFKTEPMSKYTSELPVILFYEAWERRVLPWS